MESVSQFINENIHYQNEDECYKTNTIWKKKCRHLDIYKIAILFSQIVLLIEFFSLFLS